MKPYRLYRQILLKEDIEEVFTFFDRPENLQQLTPPFLDFAIITPMPITMAEGAIIDYRIRLMGIPVNWRTQITKYQPPFHFTDEQIKGPYKLWRHEHNFRKKGKHTEVEDIVYFIPRGGILAPAINACFVNSKLKQIFNFREKTIKQVFKV